MNSEYGSEQRNSSLDTLKQRQKTSPTMPTLTGQQANILYTMPLQTVERLEQVLLSTLALQENIQRDKAKRKTGQEETLPARHSCVR